MDLFTLINFARWSKPVLELWSQKWFMLLSGVLSAVGARAVDLIQTDWDLVAILIVVYLVDLGFGLYKSKRGKIPITSLSARQSIIKGIEYFIFLGILVLISNGFEKYTTEEHSVILEYTSFLIKDIDVIGFFGVIWIEFKSIIENMTDTKGTIGRVFKKITDKIKQKEDI